MEYCTRIFRSPNLTSHLRSSAVFRPQSFSNCTPDKHSPFVLPFVYNRTTTTISSSSSIPFRCIRASNSGRSSFSPRVSDKFGLFSSLTSSTFGSVSPNVDGNSNKFSDSNLSTHGGDIAAGDKEPLVTAVLLGWLGGKPKHLRRYAELYNSRGINSVNFVVSPKEVVSIDKGKKLEGRIESLSREIESWLSDSIKDGRDRFLIFHTFSNTGWFVYGSILDKFQEKKDLLEKIKGCVFDSGPDPELNPKVWAAGFSTAILQKQSSAVYPSDKENKEATPFLEAVLLSFLEKMFNVLFDHPYINGKLKRVIDILSNKQPSCPQLYLYSYGDRVVPYQSIESYIEDQKRKGGRKILSFNFCTSPHVDHFRSFPEIYSSQIYNFLEVCLSKNLPKRETMKS